MKKKNIGSTLDSLFRETGELDEMNERLSKRIFVEQLRRAMRKRRISLSEVARRMRTSRPSVYRLLDPSFSGVTLESLARASAAVGMALEPRLVERRATSRRSKAASVPARRLEGAPSKTRSFEQLVRRAGALPVTAMASAESPSALAVSKRAVKTRRPGSG